MSHHHHTWVGMAKKAVFVSAMLASTQLWAHHNCHYHSQPEMWQSHHEMNWSAVHTFHHPMVHGAPYNFCLQDGKYCGRAAANQFCRMNGFRYSTQFKMEQRYGMTNSMSHSYRHHYNGQLGHAFHSIRCRS